MIYVFEQRRCEFIRIDRNQPCPITIYEKAAIANPGGRIL